MCLMSHITPTHKSLHHTTRNTPYNISQNVGLAHFANKLNKDRLQTTTIKKIQCLSVHYRCVKPNAHPHIHACTQCTRMLMKLTYTNDHHFSNSIQM